MKLKEITKLPALPARAPGAHKGDFGRVLVVAGSRGMAGAAVLCAQAALRAGAGLVHLAVPEDVYPIVASQIPCVICHPMPQTGSGTLSRKALGEIKKLAAEHDVIALGPGLTACEETTDLVQQFILDVEKPMVVDADGINALAADPEILLRIKGPRILTPHPGEMARLIGKTAAHVQSSRAETAADFAKTHGVCLVLKGMNTVVTDGERVYTNSTGNPGMATAGSGDVLTGLTAGLWGQALGNFEAAQLAVYLHATAGDIAREELTEYSMTACDILDLLPQAFVNYATECSHITRVEDSRD